jgi:hypothetical protein
MGRVIEHILGSLKAVIKFRLEIEPSSDPQVCTDLETRFKM